MHHTSTSSYTSNFIEIKETFCGQTNRHLLDDGHTDGQTTFETHFIKSTRKSQPKNSTNSVSFFLKNKRNYT